jgi:hypothetical protein
MARKIAFVVASGVTVVMAFALLAMGAGGFSSGDGSGATAGVSAGPIATTEIITMPAAAEGAVQDLSLPSASAPVGVSQSSSVPSTDDASFYLNGDDDDSREHGSASGDDSSDGNYEHEGQEVYED